MPGVRYPDDWSARRGVVLEIYDERCANCRREDIPLEVHHVVPVERAGSHRRTNLAPLCATCHAAAHGDGMAPRVKWYTNGDLSPDEFAGHLELWKQMCERLGVPRYDPDAQCVYVPLADRDVILSRLAT